ncbi:hypothetical protein Hanom_Chr10g00890061 [Helianthus anomalus]
MDGVSLDLVSFDVSVFDPDTGTEVFLKKSTADDDMIVEQKLPADVCEDDLEGNKKDVKGKSKVYETQVFKTKNEYRSSHLSLYIS